jgi:hypothetical protein
MFGSLVVILPTPHTGGALVFRHAEREWTFNSGAELAATGGPRVAYAAFFSNVEHEVLPVTSGHRVTVTYNLYWDHSPDVPDVAASVARAQDEVALRKALAALLGSPEVLPEGGVLAFGLRHEYPVGEDRSLAKIDRALKGPDALLARALRRLGLRAKVMAHYKPDDQLWLCEDLVDFGIFQVEDPEDVEKIRDAGGMPINVGSYSDLTADDETPIYWVTPLGTQVVEQPYVHYGNEVRRCSILPCLLILMRTHV